MTRPVRFAVVGARGYARSLLRYVWALVKEGRGQFVASMLRNRAAYPDVAAGLEGRGVRLFSDYTEMLAACKGQVDVVVLPTAIHYHAPMTIAALQAGYDVFVEKPVAARVSDVDDMIAARRASGKMCAVGFQQIYSPVIQTVKDHIVRGRLGRVKQIRIMALWPRNPSYYARNSWAGKLVADGRPVFDSPFNNALAHQIMNLLYLASPEPQRAAQPAEIEAELFRAYDIESFDTGCIRVRTDSGVQVLFAASHACGENVDPLMKLEAELGTVECELTVGATLSFTDGITEAIDQGDPRTRMFDNVLDVLAGRVPEPTCTLEIGRAHVACIEKMHRETSIASVAPRHVSIGEEGQRAIVGVDRAIRSAFATGKLFSETGTPFAKES